MMKNYKLAVFDIDSTLVNDKRQLTPYTKAVLDQWHAEGKLLGLASGRPCDELGKCASNWGMDFDFDLLIGMNGAQLYQKENKQLLSYFLLKPEWIKEILALMSCFEANPFIYQDEHILAKKMNSMMEKSAKSSNKPVIIASSEKDFYQEPNAKIMFRMDKELMPTVESYVKDRLVNKPYAAFKTQTTLLEFADRRISKAYALKKYCQLHHILLDEVMAFGDTTNDNEMIIEAGLGVAMINGSEDTKQIADDITAYSNNEDGVGHYLKAYI